MAIAKQQKDSEFAISACRTGNASICQKTRMALQSNAEVEAVTVVRENCRKRQKRICLPRFSGCERKMNT